MNTERPLSKPTNFLMINSVQVLWGKGEKYSDKVGEKDPEIECL